MEDVKLVCLI